MRQAFNRFPGWGLKTCWSGASSKSPRAIPLQLGSQAAHLEAPLLGYLLNFGQHRPEPPILLLQDPDADVIGLYLLLYVVCNIAGACGDKLSGTSPHLVEQDLRGHTCQLRYGLGWWWPGKHR